MHAQVLSHVWLFVTSWAIACQAPLFMGLFLARILEWVAISFSKGSSWKRDPNHISLIKIINYCTAKETVNKLKRQPTDWEKIFANDVAFKGLIFQIYSSHSWIFEKKKKSNVIKFLIYTLFPIDVLRYNCLEKSSIVLIDVRILVLCE